MVALFIMPHFHKVGALSIDGRRLSVCSVPDPRSRMEGRRKLKIGRKEVMTWVNHDPI